MAELVFHVNVTDEDLNDFYKNEIENIPKEKLQEVLLKALEYHLTNNPDWLKMPNFGSQSIEATSFAKSIFAGVDCEDEVKRLAEELRGFIREKYADVMEVCVRDLIVSNLFTEENKRIFMTQLTDYVNG